MEMTVELLKNIVDDAHVEGNKAYNAYIGDGDFFCGCGFAWTIITKYNGVAIKGNTKIGRLLKKVGITQNYYREFEVWDRNSTQNVGAKLAYQEAFAKHLRDNGFNAYAGSRLD